MAEENTRDLDHFSREMLRADEVIARIPREALQAMFYMFTGKPDSIVKIFDRRIVITIRDIEELNLSIAEKLDNHRIEGVFASVDIGYENNKIDRLSSWDDFVSKNWNIADITDHILVKWDFLIKLPKNPVPQRHTLVVRLSSSIDHVQFLQLLLSRDFDELEKLDEQVAPCHCRVDFINHILSQELINVVEEWNKSRSQPTTQAGFYHYLKKIKIWIARAIHYSLPLCGALIALSFLHNSTSQLNLEASPSLEDMRNMLYWLTGISFAVIILTKLGHNIANKAYVALSNYGKTAIFNITNGDRNYSLELEKRNQNSVRKFFFTAIVALVINVIGGLISWQLISP